MTAESKPIYNRSETFNTFRYDTREAIVAGLKWTVFGTLASSAIHFFLKPDSYPYRSPPINDYIQRNGIFIAGEQNQLIVGGREYYVKVNERSFLETLAAYAKKGHQEEQLNQFLARYPLRIDLFSEQDIEEAAYQSSTEVKKPTLLFSDNFLKKYASAITSSNPSQIEELDSTILHELWHEWQDITSDIFLVINPVDAALKIGLPVGGYEFLSGLENFMRKIVESDKNKNISRSNFLNLIKALALISLGFTLSSEFSPVEWDAYQMQGQLVRWPELAKFRGQYFSFTQVS